MYGEVGDYFSEDVYDILNDDYYGDVGYEERSWFLQKVSDLLCVLFLGGMSVYLVL